MLFAINIFSMQYVSVFDNWSSAAKKSTSVYASRKLDGDQSDKLQRLMLRCVFSLKFGYSFDK